MKAKLLLLLVSSFIIRHSAFAQGALTPPGAPAPTMKSLAQIEPRTPISSVPFTITNSGSYYLTGNLTVSSGDAITIATNGVTLDLSGFTISSTAASAAGYAINLSSGLKNLVIKNGIIQSEVTNNGSGVYSGSGFAGGIVAPGIDPVNARVSGVSVSGCLYYGIYLAANDSTLVESCTVRTVGGFGINATTVKSSVVVDCGSIGIYGTTVSDCTGVGNTGYGIYASNAQNCSGTGTSGYGIYAFTAQNCSGTSSSSYGLYVNNVAIGCSGSSASGTGLYALIANVCHGASGTGTALSTSHNVNSY